MDGKAKDEFSKRGYGLEMEDKQKGTRMRAAKKSIRQILKRELRYESDL